MTLLSEDRFPATFTAAVVPVHSPQANDICLLFAAAKLLLHKGEQISLLTRHSLAEAGVEMPAEALYLGQWGEFACYTAALPAGLAAEKRPAGWSLQPLRRLRHLLPSDAFWLAGGAYQIWEWAHGHRFCGRCGQRTTYGPAERAVTCPACGYIAHHNPAPAVIMAVVRRETGHILLARSHRHPPQLFSVLAGFVDPGESLEETVAREVCEEVGITVENIRYFGSQTWPFPNSIMIGFTADYVSGEIRLQASEMAAADWYTAADLPRIPPRMTIARQLIDWFVAGG